MIIILLETLIFLIIKQINRKKIKTTNRINKNIRNGKYITLISNCISCHTIDGGKPFTGGVSIKTKFGIINTPNIISKKEGLNKIKLKDFIKLIKLGISKKKNFIMPGFPYINYQIIKKKDIKDMFLFFKKNKADDMKNKKNLLKFPIKYKKILIGWRMLFFKKFNLKKKKKSNIKRGNYISESMAHCSLCHTKINKIGKINKYFKYKGNSEIEKWKSTEIINNKHNGLKKIKIQEIYKILKEGSFKNKIINSVMVEIINNSLQYISKIDLISISRYIKSKINNKKILEIKKKKIINYKNEKKTYKNNCIQCHGKLNLGNYPIYPKIIKKNRNKNQNRNNLKNLIKKIITINTIKNKYPSLMPIFNKIKKLKNYINVNKNLWK